MRPRTLAAGLAALAGLVTLVAGLPVLLYRYGGSPLPHRLADVHQLAAMLSSGDDGGLLIPVIRDCAWLAWLLFTASVVVEAHAALRGRRAPLLRLGGIQGAAAQLVALTAVAFSTPAAIILTSSLTAVTSGHGTAEPGEAPSPASLDRALIADNVLVTVHPGDCLWSIAQRYLGAGDLYPEIAQLNYGRQMGDGEVFTNPALIMPGWQLVVPASRTSSAPQSGAAQPAGSQHPGHATKDEHYRRSHSAASTRPTGTEGGNEAERPSAGSSARADGADRADGAAAARGADQADSRRPDAGAPAAGPVVEAAVFVSGALAGAVLTSLTRLRFRQRQERRRGRRIALAPEPAVLATEQRLRAAAPAEPPYTLRGALACLEAGLLAAAAELPDIVGVHVTPGLLEVLLAAPAADAPPAPYAVSPGRQGMCWQLELPAVAALAASDAPCHLLPGLVTIGSTDAGYLLLDLESLQVTGCDGAPALVDQLLATIATELATSQWSGWYELLLVGCDELAPVGRAEHCASLEQALSILEARCAQTAQRAATRATAAIRELRVAEPDNEDWVLTIVVSRAPPSPDQLTRLLDLAIDSWGGIGVLFAGDPESADGRMAPTVLQLAPDPDATGGVVANVVPLQIVVRPRALSAAEYDAIATLFTVAADVNDVAPDEQPYSFYGAPPWIPQAATPSADVPDPTPEQQEPEGETDGPLPTRDTGPLEVRILGPFTIAGAAEQLQPKQAELVLALALAAPAGLSNSALCGMLGADPDHPKPSDAIRQIITRTRRRLGLAGDGREHIIHAGNARYVLHPDVSLDWSRFRELAASGRADDLRAALALVHGPPFTGSYFWWIEIPLVETIRAEIVDAAEMLAELELTAGAPRAAARAARAGLLADAAAEQLWRAVMRAEHAAGNLAGVTDAWRCCLDAIEDIAPGGEPHPDTAALYHRLTTGAREHAPMH